MKYSASLCKIDFRGSFLKKNVFPNFSENREKSQKMIFLITPEKSNNDKKNATNSHFGLN